ncbi:MAG TPA: hypothetical protein VH482_28345 [Thermomicrobiales bacterium]
MLRTITVDETEQEIETVMREQRGDRIEAETIVGLLRGELHGDNDILVLRPLTDEQRCRLGLGRSIDDVLTAQRVRQNSDASPTPAAVDRSS